MGFLVCTYLLFLHLAIKTWSSFILFSSTCTQQNSTSTPVKHAGNTRLTSHKGLPLQTNQKIYISLKPCLTNAAILRLPTAKHSVISNSEVRHGFKPFHFSELRHDFRNFLSTSVVSLFLEEIPEKIPALSSFLWESAELCFWRTSWCPQHSDKWRKCRKFPKKQVL